MMKLNLNVKQDVVQMDNLPTQEDWNKLYAPNGVFPIRKMFRELFYCIGKKCKKYMIRNIIVSKTWVYNPS